jgi:biopolymer transport protein ExbD
MAVHNRAKAMREARRAQQFSKFRLHQLNLVPLVDTFVSIVFFALTTQTVGELMEVPHGVALPESRVGQPALQQLTLAISSAPAEITFANQRLMSVQEAARATSDTPQQPLKIPALYQALRATADSIRSADNIPSDQSVTVPLAIMGDRTMRYDLLSRVMQTARLAGFSNVTLQVLRTGEEGAEGAPTQATRQN